MRLARLPHVPLIAAALLAPALTLFSAVPARAAAAPQAVTVCIDPGHGGVPGDPSGSWDGGAIGINGLLEKDMTLDVSLRLRNLLQEDLVNVVMTRTTDINLGIDQRSAIANASGAAVFLSIHFNAYTDSSAGGSLVLYPGQKDLGFAQTMDAAMAKNLGPLGITDGGTQLRDDWWIHVKEPVATVEPLYMTNTHEADLLSKPAFRDTLAQSLRQGVETFLPQIQAHKKEQQAAAANPLAGISLRPLHGNLNLPFWLLLVVGAVAAVRWRRKVGKAVAVIFILFARLTRHLIIHRRAQRRRRRLIHARSLAFRDQRLARPHSVYDKLFL